MTTNPLSSLLLSSSKHRLTLATARILLNGGYISAQELCLYCYHLQQAGEKVWGLHAFSQCTPLDVLLEQAEQADQRRRDDNARLSDLDGIPVSIKANLAVESFPLTAGSRILGASSSSSSSSSLEDSPQFAANIGYNATVVESLQKAGAVIMGITTMDEFGMGSLGTNQGDGRPTKNPLPYLQQHAMMAMRNNISINIDKDIDVQKRSHMRYSRWTEIIQSSSDEIHQAHEMVKDAMDADNEAIATTTTHHDYSAGGSSCGSATSVAHGSSLISLGSDTGGSVRLPAAFTNLVGLKPTYGRLSRHGLVGYASSLDTVGIVAPSAYCASLTMEELLKQQGGRKEENDQQEALRDSNSSDWTEQQSTDDFVTTKRINNILTVDTIIGIPEAFSVQECPHRIRSAWTETAKRLEANGATIRIIPAAELSPVVLQSSLAAYYVLVSAEASSNLARYDGFRYGTTPWDQRGTKTEMDIESLNDVIEEWEALATPRQHTLLEHQFATTRSCGFGPEVIRRILCGTAVLSSDRFHQYYEAAAKLRAVLTQQLHKCLEADACDALLVPTSLSLPPRLDELAKMDPVDIYANDVMTVPASLAGLPALAIPSPGGPMEEGEPFQTSMQLIGARMSEDKLLDIASTLEITASWKRCKEGWDWTEEHRRWEDRKKGNTG